MRQLIPLTCITSLFVGIFFFTTHSPLCEEVSCTPVVWEQRATEWTLETHQRNEIEFDVDSVVYESHHFVTEKEAIQQLLDWYQMHRAIHQQPQADLEWGKLKDLLKEADNAYPRYAAVYTSVYAENNGVAYQRLDIITCAAEIVHLDDDREWNFY